MTARCIDCGRSFLRRAHYEIRCISCWKAWKGIGEELRQPVQALPDPRLPDPTEWCDMLPRLLRLAHPDRHSNSQMANIATAWLIRQRDRLGAA